MKSGSLNRSNSEVLVLQTRSLPGGYHSTSSTSEAESTTAAFDNDSAESRILRLGTG